MTLMLGSFATMLEAGVPLYRALHHLGQNSSDPQAGMLCQALVHDVGNGKPLSKAAARHPKAFTSMQIGLMKVGETAGCLDEVLKRLVGFEEKAQANELKIRSALTYPAILLVICLLAIALAPPLLLEPHFALIRDLKVEIPWPTAMLMAFSAWMRSPWPYLGLVAVAFAVVRFVMPFLGRRDVQLAMTRRALTTPKLKELVRGVLTTRFARALALQLEAGVPVQQALHLAGRVTGNPLLEEVGDHLVKSMLNGRSLSQSMRSSQFFSPMFLSVVAVGEETGDVAKLVDWLADLGETQVDHALETVAAMIEPFVMAGIGILVGAMVLATLLPLSKALDAI
ncbi:MAG: type II secretion system F family protein [Candidatus Eremiobacteraeota bacterium]|nr:type II secretion system F family protein [Candidatus Eremiobacteraeota bacterium]